MVIPEKTNDEMSFLSHENKCDSALKPDNSLAVFNTTLISLELSDHYYTLNQNIIEPRIIGLFTLPTDIIMMIFRLLSASELVRLMTVSKLSNKLASNRVLWEKLLKSVIKIPISELIKFTDHPKKIYANFCQVSIYFSIMSSNLDTVVIKKHIPISDKLYMLFNHPNKIAKLLYITPNKLLICEALSLNIHLYDLLTLKIIKSYSLRRLGYSSHSIFSLNISLLSNNKLFISHSEYGGFGATSAATLDLENDDFKFLYSNQSDTLSFNLNPQTELANEQVVFRSCHPDMVTIGNPSTKFSYAQEHYFGNYGTITAIETIDSNFFAIGWKSGIIIFVDILTFKLSNKNPLNAGTDPVNHLVDLFDKKIASGSGKGEVIIWDLLSEKQICRTLIQKSIYSIGRMPYRYSELIIVTNQEILTWNWLNNECICLIQLQEENKITGLAISPSWTPSNILPEDRKNIIPDRQKYFSFWQNAKMPRIVQKDSKDETHNNNACITM